ncbi:hypothetical protein [Aestuariivita sp.]|uniref:hypothetical protein n=1 Tax=Aestuariivita sp. TaxID=1872407 RepID=UPI00216FA309|nr:hypothetical protein [Aestuariivita sp.]MCE8006328.1 hypothetical protein [Aestuariivita sp.]
MSAETAVTEQVLREALDVEPSYFRIFVGAIDTDGHLVYVDQTSENGPFADSFTTLTDLSFESTPLQASTTMDGYVSLLAEQKDTHHLIYVAENQEPNAPERFNLPVDLGIPPSVSAFHDTKLINGLNGRPNVFGTSANKDGAIWWKFMNPYQVETVTETVIPPGTDTPIEVTVEVPALPSQPWSDWIQIPGSLVSITATQNADGRLIIGGLNANKTPFINFQNSDRPQKPESWIGWQDVSGYVGELEQLELAIDGNALVHIFGAVGSNIYMRVQTATAEDTFTDWVLLAGFDADIQDFAVGVSANNGLYLTAQVGSGQASPIYATHQTGSDLSEWTTPAVIAFAQSDSQYALHPNANRALSLFALDTRANMIDYTTELRPSLWQAGWTRIGTNLTSMAITQDVTASFAQEE